MLLIVNRVREIENSRQDLDSRQLLYLGSCLYDFYLLVEDCLVTIAGITDRWIPGSLDWHKRLIDLLQRPVPETRPALLSAKTAALLADHLSLYLNYHHHSTKLTAPRIKKLTGNLDQLYHRLEKELAVFK